MNKNILIMGIGRAGKTTLSKMLKDEINSYNLIHSDALKWAMIRAKNQEEYYRTNIDKAKEFEQGEYFQKTLLEFFNTLIKNDKNGYGYILECDQTNDLFTHSNSTKGNKKLSNSIGLITVAEYMLTGGGKELTDSQIILFGFI